MVKRYENLLHVILVMQPNDHAVVGVQPLPAGIDSGSQKHE